MRAKNVFRGSALVLILLAACKKYPDGPVFSLESRVERVVNTWQVQKVLLNGSDITSSYTDIFYIETYDKFGDYSYSSTYSSGIGKWAFENKHSQIKRGGVGGQPTVDMTILRLKERSFWYKFTVGNDTYEFHLAPA